MSEGLLPPAEGYEDPRKGFEEAARLSSGRQTPDVTIMMHEIDQRALESRLEDIGVVFDGARPRELPNIDPYTNRLVGANIVGSPLYFGPPKETEGLLPSEVSADEVRLHEMVHGFVQAHLVPGQPKVPVAWEAVTDEEAVALVQDSHEVGQKGSADIIEAAKDALVNSGLGLTSYRTEPLAALGAFVESIDDLRKTDRMIRGLAERRGREVERPSVEAVAACVNQRLVATLRAEIYRSVGLSRGIDFEEAVATYFAHHALGSPPVEASGFHQGERAKQYTLMLADRYPNPRALAGQLVAEGMRGVLTSNQDIFEAAEPVDAAHQAVMVVEGYEPLGAEDLAARKTQLLRAYTTFGHLSEVISGQMQADPEILRNRALGEGRDMMALRIQHNDRAYVVRVPLHDDAADINERLEGAIRGMDIDILETAVAASPTTGFFYSELLPGKTIRNVGYKEQHAITDEQLVKLVSGVMQATSREISFDVDQGNIFYDPDAGFSIADYSHSPQHHYSTAKALVSIAGSIGAMGRGNWGQFTTETTRQRQFDFSVSLLQRFADQCSRMISDPVIAEQIRQGIDRQITGYIVNMTNPRL